MNTLWVIGDSTLSSFTDKYYYPRYGYGTMLDKYLDDEITVENIALSGRSSKSYTTEPEYQQLLDGMSDGDFLIIGFGHNDQKTEADRYTDANGGINDEGSFANSLYRNYIEPAVKAGCKPILCTPIVRRASDGIWTDQLLHVTEAAGGFPGGDYAESIRRLGRELNIPVIDMTEITKNRYDRMGADQTMYLHAWTSVSQLSVDNTHTNIWGARVNAYDVLAQVKENHVEGICEHITTDKYEHPLNQKEEYLVSNPDYVPTVFSDDLADSKLWQDYTSNDGTVFKGTVFGDIGQVSMADNFVLETDSDGNLHMAAKNSIGKIAGVSDGLAMYYKKLDVTQHFVLTAQLQINDYFSNDQVSFGLMARDDMYVDYATADILGDYVAAAPLLLTHGEAAVNCFARKSGILTFGGTCTRAYKPGDTVNLRLESTSDGFACTFGDEKTITGGFDFALTAVDPKHVYIGMFAARFADVTFKNIELKLK